MTSAADPCTHPVPRHEPQRNAKPWSEHCTPELQFVQRWHRTKSPQVQSSTRLTRLLRSARSTRTPPQQLPRGTPLPSSCPLLLQLRLERVAGKAAPPRSSILPGPGVAAIPAAGAAHGEPVVAVVLGDARGAAPQWLAVRTRAAPPVRAALGFDDRAEVTHLVFPCTPHEAATTSNAASGSQA
jgi:hypothetical protein